VGDFKETIDEHFNGLSKIIADFQLVDLMKGGSSNPFPATYARGKHRLDFGLATRRVAEALRFAGHDTRIIVRYCDYHSGFRRLTYATIV
jgi:hypothetical protein